MKGFSTILTVIAGLIVSPYAVALTEYFIPRGPEWFPYVVVLIVAGVLWAVGIDMLRPVAAAIVIGVVLFGLGVKYAPDWVDFFGVDVRTPF